MRNKMINHGIAIIGIVILILLSIGSASAPPYGGPDAEVTYVEIDVEKRTINSNPAYYAAGTGFKLINSHLDRNIFEISVSTGIYGSDSIKFDRKTIEELFPLFDIRSKNVPYPTTVYISVHPKDPAKPKANLYYRLDKIEGLMSLEEAQALVAQEQNARAERTAQEEAQRLAVEEANRYDPAKFIIVPSNFRPANYTRADLFEAVAVSERLSATPVLFGTLVYPSRDFVSDVVFVSQNGTDIIFRTGDNAISRTMKVESRTGLTSGQRVRIYYTVYRIQDWQVVAIERL